MTVVNDVENMGLCLFMMLHKYSQIDLFGWHILRLVPSHIHVTRFPYEKRDIFFTWDIYIPIKLGCVVQKNVKILCQKSSTEVLKSVLSWSCLFFIGAGFWNRNHNTPKPWDADSRSRSSHQYDDYQLPVMAQDEGLPLTGNHPCEG